MKAMRAHSHAYILADKKQIAFLRTKWLAGWDADEIGRRIGVSDKLVRKLADTLGLPRRSAHTVSKAQRVGERSCGFAFSQATRRLGPSLRHRRALGFSDPVRISVPASIIGAPIRVVEPQTRALIDAAVAARSSA